MGTKRARTRAGERRGPAARIGVAVAALLLGGNGNARLESPLRLADMPNVRVVYYDVEGDSPERIEQSVLAQSLLDPASRQPVHALTEWRYDWRWSTDDAGRCDLTNATASVAVTVRLPRHAAEESMPEPLRERWRRFMASLEAHEAAHARLALDGLDEIERAVRSATCDTANDAGRAAAERISRANADYDWRTRNGATEGAAL